MAFKVFILLVFVECVFRTGDTTEQWGSKANLLSPCDVDDFECIGKTTRDFLEATHKGLPEYNIQAIDPLVIPSLEYKVEKDKLVLRFGNLTISGLKGQKIHDFKMDTQNKSVLLSTVSDLLVNGDLTVELNDQYYPGNYSVEGKVISTARYSYDVKEDEQGVRHYVVGPETISSEVVGEPKVSIQNDEESHIKNVSSKLLLIKMADAAFVTVIHNIRAAAKVLPTSSFFNNLS